MSLSDRRFTAIRLIFFVFLVSVTGSTHDVPEREALFRADSRLVLVPVVVVDKRGAIVSHLKDGDFALTENGKQQQIISVSKEEGPVSIGVVLDLSGSMKRTLGGAKESMFALLENANPADEVFLNAVSSRPRTYVEFTKDFGALLSRVAFENAAGSTALFDTIYASFDKLRPVFTSGKPCW